MFFMDIETNLQITFGDCKCKGIFEPLWGMYTNFAIYSGFLVLELMCYLPIVAFFPCILSHHKSHFS